MPGLRPLAVIAILLAAMFALKSVSLADSAVALMSTQGADEPQVLAPRAEPEDQPETAPPAVTPAPVFEPEPDEFNVTRSQFQLCELVENRRVELDMREEDLDTREALLEVAEQRIEARIARMEALETSLETLLGTLETERERRVGEIVSVYAQLEPENAAAIMSRMDEDTLVLLAESLQRDQARRYAAILAEMDPGFAAELTLRLRSRANPPETQTEVEARLAGRDS
ncbi:MotE family protein [Glycocaulis abyssi]|uniref:MotE family protein n=1 Tax=Glycocaulis abyssi TaxID=1433403 RepID=A0ABV9NCT4_9PROT